MNKNRLNILIVGGGDKSETFIRLFNDNDAVNLVSVVDKDPGAPGIKFAVTLGVNTSDSYKSVIEKYELDEIINITGDKNIQQDILRIVPENVVVIGEKCAGLIYDLITEKLRVTEALGESEYKYKAMFDHAADLIAVVDPSGNFTDLNNRFEEESEYTREEMIGKNIFTCGILTPESAVRTLTYLKQLLRGEQLPIFEVCGITKTGGIVPYELRAVPIRKDGKTVKVQAILRNISQRKQAEQERNEKAEKLRLITENTSEFISMTDLEGEYIFVSPSFARLGYEKEDLIGKKIYNFIHPDDIEKVKKLSNKKGIFSRLMRKGQMYLNEILKFRMLNKAGQWREIESTVNIAEKGQMGEKQLVFISRDITEKKQIFNEIHRQKEVLSNVISNIPDFVFWKNTDSVYMGCNDNFAKVSGLKNPEQIVGKTDYDLAWKKEEADFFRRCDRVVLDTGKPMLNIEEPQLQADGKEAILLTSKVPLRDSNGKVIGILGIYTDITESKNVERKLRQSESRYRTIFENTGTSTIILNVDMTILMVNAEFESLVGYPKSEIERKKNFLFFVEEDDVSKTREYHRLRRIDPEAVPRRYEIKITTKEGAVRDIFLTVAIIPGTDKSLISLLDITEIKHTEFELKKQKDLLGNVNKALEHKLKELEKAVSHIKTLEGLVPICAGCKKMRIEGGDPKDSDSWVNLEKYISDRTDASFTHGLCPECIRRMYGDIKGRKDKKND